MRFWIIIILLKLFTGPPYCLGQEVRLVISGSILDSKSGQPIVAASVKSGRQMVISNANGEFKINVQVGDRLYISHVGYHSIFYPVGETMSPYVEFFLIENIMDLPEAEVNAFISEERFKSEVLLAVPQYEYEHRIVSRNLQLIKQISPIEFARDLSSYERFFKNLKSPGEVSFFSSHPSVGLFKGLRQIGQKRTYRAPSYLHTLPPRQLKKPGTEIKKILPGNNLQ